MMEMKRYINGNEVVEGLRLASPAQMPQFAIAAVCDSVAPDSWHGEVTLNGVPILRTRPAASDDQASRDAAAALRERWIALFSEPA